MVETYDKRSGSNTPLRFIKISVRLRLNPGASAPPWPAPGSINKNLYKYQQHRTRIKLSLNASLTANDLTGREAPAWSTEPVPGPVRRPPPADQPQPGAPRHPACPARRASTRRTPPRSVSGWSTPAVPDKAPGPGQGPGQGPGPGLGAPMRRCGSTVVPLPWERLSTSPGPAGARKKTSDSAEPKRNFQFEPKQGLRVLLIFFRWFVPEEAVTPLRVRHSPRFRRSDLCACAGYWSKR